MKYVLYVSEFEKRKPETGRLSAPFPKITEF